MFGPDGEAVDNTWGPLEEEGLQHQSEGALVGEDAMARIVQMIRDEGARPLHHNILTDGEEFWVSIRRNEILADGSFVMWFRLRDGQIASLKVRDAIKVAQLEPPTTNTTTTITNANAGPAQSNPHVCAIKSP